MIETVWLLICFGCGTMFGALMMYYYCSVKLIKTFTEEWKDEDK